MIAPCLDLTTCAACTFVKIFIEFRSQSLSCLAPMFTCGEQMECVDQTQQHTEHNDRDYLMCLNRTPHLLQEYGRSFSYSVSRRFDFDFDKLTFKCSGVDSTCFLGAFLASLIDEELTGALGRWTIGIGLSTAGPGEFCRLSINNFNLVLWLWHFACFLILVVQLISTLHTLQ